MSNLKCSDTALARWLIERAMSLTAFAREVGITVSAASRLTGGSRLPSVEVAVRIQQLTEGQVSPDSFVEARRAQNEKMANGAVRAAEPVQRRKLLKSPRRKDPRQATPTA